MAVTLYRQVGKGKNRRYQKVNLGRGRRPADLTGPYFLRYSLADGTRSWEHVGDDLRSGEARLRTRPEPDDAVQLSAAGGTDCGTELAGRPAERTGEGGSALDEHTAQQRVAVRHRQELEQRDTVDGGGDEGEEGGGLLVGCEVLFEFFVDAEACGAVGHCAAVS